MCLSLLLFIIILEVNAKRQEKQIIYKLRIIIQIEKEEIKPWQDHLCKKIWKNWKKTLLELISNYSEVVGYKISKKKAISFLYTSNEQVEYEIKNPLPFTLVPPKG